MSLFPKKKQL